MASNKQVTLVNVFKSQIIQDPSALALTAWSLFFLIFIKLKVIYTYMLHTLPLCSFMEASITWVYFPIFHTLTSPSEPPEIILDPFEVVHMAVTP